MTTLELSAEEIQMLAQALDTHLRQHGAQVCCLIGALLIKLQQAAQGLQPS